MMSHYLTSTAALAPNFWRQGNTTPGIAWVSNAGNDGTAVVGNSSFPFLNYASAQNSPATTIAFFAGDYQPTDDEPLKLSGTFIFQDGANVTLQSNTARSGIWEGGSETFNVLGAGYFDSSACADGGAAVYTNSFTGTFQSKYINGWNVDGEDGTYYEFQSDIVEGAFLQLGSNCIIRNSKFLRTFSYGTNGGFSTWRLENCVLQPTSGPALQYTAEDLQSPTIQNCRFITLGGAPSITATGSGLIYFEAPYSHANVAATGVTASPSNGLIIDL